jgi:hypothetical protein
MAEKKVVRGGAREGAGRKAESGEPVFRKNVSISETDEASYLELGDGVFSTGLHRGAALVRKELEKKAKKALRDV